MEKFLTRFDSEYANDVNETLFIGVLAEGNSGAELNPVRYILKVTSMCFLPSEPRLPT